MFALCAATAIAASAQTFTTLFNFDRRSGENPVSILTQGRDGNFYGATYSGGVSVDCRSLGCGTVFKVSPDGRLTTLYSFCALTGDCTGGYEPDAGLGSHRG